MVQPANTAVSRSSSVRLFQQDIGVLIPAFLAMLVLQMFRADQSRWLPAIYMETAFFVVFPFAVFWMVCKWAGSGTSNLQSTSAFYVSQAGAILAGMLTIVWQVVGRSNGLGDANEVVALLVLQNIGWYLAVFSKVRGFERTSLILCGALVFFVCSMTERVAIFVIAGVYAVVALWWLAGLYWDRLDTRAIDGNSRILPVRSMAIGISVLVIGGIAAIVTQAPALNSQIGVRGFLPFSGGEHGFADDFARSGFGDGHMLTAGNNATTTGAVDSDQFIQDHKESMYDVSLERYDGPVFKQRRNRSVTLDAIAKHMHDVKQSEQSGRTFRTMRESEETADIELESKVTRALFFVEGSVPARFAIDSFNQFDGWDWSKSPVGVEDYRPPRIQLQRGRTCSVYQICRVKSKFLTSSRRHRVKLMRLKSSCIPAPAFLDRWHIAYVEDPDLFRWSEAGLVQMDGEFIPTHTVIDMESHVPNLHALHAGHYTRRIPPRNQNAEDDWTGRADSPLLQVPDNRTRQRISELALQWTDGVQPGWKQVEAIVRNVKTGFELNLSWQADATVEDTVGHFLQQGDGPSYMFATTCVMALRAAGYKTRLTSGFLVRKSDYDRVAQQSVVTSDNLHMWPEVLVEGKYWVPVEPTPGYPDPYSTETFGQWLTSMIFATTNWFATHRVFSILLAAGVVLAFVIRASLITFPLLLWWYLVRLFWPRGLLQATRQLIDVRFKAAGDRRPASKTIRSWYTRVEPELATGFFELWNARNYCSNPRAVSSNQLVGCCREQIRVLTLRKIKGFTQTKKTGK